MKPKLIIASIAVLAVGAGALFFLRQGPIQDPPSCPEASQFPPEWAALKNIELEHRLLDLRVFPPSQAQAQLAEFRTRRDTKPEGERACAYRAEIEQALLLGRHVGEVGETWGQTREVEELKKLLLEAPLTNELSPEQRQAAIDFVEKTFVATQPSVLPGDADFWRRMYLGIELLCLVTPEELKMLHARRRPLNCAMVAVH